jgi:hypothetical protein
MRYGNFDIRHGDRVSFADERYGKAIKRSGLAVGLLMSPGHLVLDMGGKFGRPQVVYPEQILAVRRAKEKA